MTIKIDGTNTTANPGIRGTDDNTGIEFAGNDVRVVCDGVINTAFFDGGNLYKQNGGIVLANGGIKFGLTLGQSELSDYEEGTFTPYWYGSTTAGTYTFDSAYGSYTKIGRQVFIQASMVDITGTNGSGTARIGGLPFSASSQTGVSFTGTIRYDTLDIRNSANGVVTIIGRSNDYIRIYEVGDDLDDSDVAVNDISSGTTDIFVSITYWVD